MKHYFLCLMLLISSALVYADADRFPLRNAVTPVNDVYTINTAADLIWVAQASEYNDFEGKTIRLAANININDAASDQEWPIIGSATLPFQGLFDGQCYAISNFRINEKSLTATHKSEIGMFGVIGSKGVVQDVAIASGSILIEKIENVGALAGINNGTIQRCFNMAHITDAGGRSIGGLVGVNNGTIAYCYNVGYISDGSANVGGLVGKNSATATVTDCYVAAYVNASGTRGAVMGDEMAGTWTNVYFDKQIGLTNPYGSSVYTSIIGVDYSTNSAAWAEFAKDASAWFIQKDSYPQLVCFHSKNADLSTVSAAMINLGVKNEAADQYASLVDKDFKVINNDGIQWAVDETVEEIEINKTEAKLNRPCANMVTYPFAGKGGWSKEVYIILKGFEPFTAGTLKDIYGPVCLGNPIPFNELQAAKAEKGKDDKKENKGDESDWYPYYYFVQGWLMKDQQPDESYKDSVLVYGIDESTGDSIVFKGDENFGGLGMFVAAQEGVYRFRLQAHDSQCQTSFKEASGYCDVNVQGEFKTGAVDSKQEIVYGGLPKTITIGEAEAVAGGMEPYIYKWRENGKVKSDAGGENISTATFDWEFTEPGKYKYTREVHDALCEKEFIKSEGEKEVIIYADIDAGGIEPNPDAKPIRLCGVSAGDIIAEAAAPAGGTPQLGDGNYKIRWMCNDAEIAGATDNSLSLEGLMNYEQGKQYKFRREVTDDSGHFPWVKSEGEYTIEIVEKFITGTIQTLSDTVYGGLPLTRTINELVPVSGGEGAYTYQWLENNKVMSGQSGNTLTKQFNSAGTYTYIRQVHDEFCASDFAQSEGEYKLVIFAEMTAGKIKAEETSTCNQNPTNTIGQTEAAKGGSGKYEYRWYCNGSLVSGAAAATLSIASLPLTAGNDYVFYREVKDKVCYKWMSKEWNKSDGEYKIHIYQPFTAGALKIQTDSFCVDSLSQAKWTVALTEETAVTGEGEMNYRWRLYEISSGKRKDVKTYTEEEIAAKGANYTFDMSEWAGLKMPATLALVREVKNPLCSNQWEESAGMVSATFAMNAYSTTKFNTCPADLPYAYTHTYKDGKTETYNFTANNEVHVFKETLATGCVQSTSVTCQMYPAPDVTVSTLGNVCQENTSITVPIKINSGIPTMYKVYFDDGLKALGLKDYEAQLFSPTEVEIETGALPMQEFRLALQFYEYGVPNTCPSLIDTVTFNINLAGFVHQKWNDILYVDNNPSNGWPNAEGDLRFVSYQWYKDGELIEGATNQYYQEEFGLNGIYYVVLTDEDGNVYRSCDIEARPGMGLTEVEIDWSDAATEVYTVTGIKLDRLPQQTGIYLVRYNAGGKIVTRKILVK